jgi:hypothetical protein
VATNLEVPVRLAEFAVNGADEYFKAHALRALGAALYRAGRCDAAIRRLEEAIPLQGRTSVPPDWPFLAMAHHRLGHRDEARRWLERLRERQPSTDSAQFWGELEIRLLQTEAEGRDSLRPGLPSRPIRALTGQKGVADGPRRARDSHSPNPMKPIPEKSGR